MLEREIANWSLAELFCLAFVLVLIAGGLFAVAGRGLAWLADWLTRSDEPLLDDRRRMIRGGAMRTRKEKRFDSLDDAALERYVKAHPRDALASEIHCERLEQAERWEEYAREFEYFLTIAGGLTIEEACSSYCRLADIYIANLGRPEKGREMLETIVARYPRHYQATLARKRIEALARRGAVAR
jgi:hypothetical protein